MKNPYLIGEPNFNSSNEYCLSMKQITKCLEDTSCFRLINPICKTYSQNTTNKNQALATVQLFTSKYFAKNIDIIIIKLIDF